MIGSLLASPSVYRVFCRFIGNEPRRVFIEKYVLPKKGEVILDIGCGPGNLLEYLPDVKYVGFDMNERYIEDAKKRFGNRGHFFCEMFDKNTTIASADFDMVVAFGILHHLSDDDVVKLFELVKLKLKHGGRAFTLDIFKYDGQPWLERILVSLDRGKYMRTEEEYVGMARAVFDEVKVHTLKGVTSLPYTGIILEMR
jgi:cyclopropane fatty-acyl-phospholipid synthase-like methyltransferase